MDLNFGVTAIGAQCRC